MVKILLVNLFEENTILEFILDVEGSDDYIEMKDYGVYLLLGILYVILYFEVHIFGYEFRLVDCVGE